MKNRDEIRASALKTRAGKLETIKDEDGIEYEVRQPTIRERSDIRELSTTTDEKTGNMNFDPSAFMIHAAIVCTFIPGTQERVFEPTDYDVLVNQPTGSIIDELGKCAAKLCNSEDKLSDAKKP